MSDSADNSNETDDDALNRQRNLATNDNGVIDASDTTNFGSIAGNDGETGLRRRKVMHAAKETLDKG